MFTVVFLGLSIIKMEKKIELLREKKKVIAKMIDAWRGEWCRDWESLYSGGELIEENGGLLYWLGTHSFDLERKK